METPARWRPTLATCWVFPAVIVWKLGLIAFAALPPPANDAFFFDGAVVNWLHRGAYVNPSIVRMFPTSGAEIFSAYPPFYQAVLAGWMSVFGPSALSAMWLHGVLFAAFALVTFAVLRRLAMPTAAINLGGAFFFAITFHDRPDSVAQLVGIFSVLAWLRAAEGDETATRWRALGAASLTLCFLTNLHVGALYFAVGIALAIFAPRRGAASWISLACAAALPAILAVAVAKSWPVAWTGLMENLRATPSITGLRLPRVDELLKIGRTVPGLLLAALATVCWLRRDARERSVLLALLGPALLATALALVFFTANFVQDVAYLQPLIVALALAALPAEKILFRRALLAAVALAAIRAVGLTTWGVACALDVSRAEAEAHARQAVEGLPPRSTVLASSAYLYALAGEKSAACYHADWAGRVDEGEGALRPACLVLTAYDYHRRFQPWLADLTARKVVRITAIERSGRVPPPDSFPSLQRVLQHVSWAPVIVRLEWR